MSSTETLLVKVTSDVTGAVAGMRTLESTLSRVGTSMSRLGTTMTRRVTVPLALLGGASLKFASDAAEVRNKVKVTFGRMAGDVLRWSKKSIESMGLASFTAQDMASQFGLLFQAAELPGPAVIQLSKQFTQLAGDVASFFNVPFEEALDTLRSGLVGETEPLRRFGVLLSEARVQEQALKMGLAETTEEISEQDKVIARAAIIMESLSKAQGDFRRTSDSAANQFRSMVEQSKEAAADLGTALLPVFTEDILPAIQDAIHWFRELPDSTKSWAVKFAIAAAALGPVASLVGGLARLGGGAVRLFSRVPGIGGVKGGTTGAMTVQAGVVNVYGPGGAGGPGGVAPVGGKLPGAAGAGVGKLLPHILGGLLSPITLAWYLLGSVPAKPTKPVPKEAINSWKLLSDAIAAGKVTSTEYNAAMEQVQAQFGDSISGAEAMSLALAMLGVKVKGIPDAKATKITTPGLDKSLYQTVTLKQTIDGLRDKTVTITVLSAAARGSVLHPPSLPDKGHSGRILRGGGGPGLRSDEELLVGQSGERLLSRAERRQYESARPAAGLGGSNAGLGEAVANLQHTVETMQSRAPMSLTLEVDGTVLTRTVELHQRHNRINLKGRG